MSDDTSQKSSYLSKKVSKKSQKNLSVTTDSLGVGKEALYEKRNMGKVANAFTGGKSTFGRRSGTR